MKFNQLSMIWDVKIFLAKIKECKGREINLSDKKNLPTKTSPDSVVKHHSKTLVHWKLVAIHFYAMEKQDG